MKKKLLVFVIVVSAALFVAAEIYAEAVPQVIKLEDPAYKEHEKGVVNFEHGKHQKEYAEKYPEFYKNGCGECHHDKENKPLTNLKEGDEVQKCIECHKIASEAPKGKKAKKKLSKKEKIKDYHAEALHENCRGCHRLFNKKVKPAKKAPTTCAKCHPGSKDE
jgi:Class III cytochrome C family